MCGVLAMLFIAVPALEIYVLITVGTEIGALATLAIIVATGVCGAALARLQGVSVLSDLQRSIATGARIGRSMVQAALVLVAGVLLLTPGFVTDAVGFLLLLPPTRTLLADWLIVRYAARAQRVVVMGDMSGFPGSPDAGGHRAGADGAGADDQDEPVEHDPPPPGVIDV